MNKASCKTYKGGRNDSFETMDIYVHGRSRYNDIIKRKLFKKKQKNKSIQSLVITLYKYEKSFWKINCSAYVKNIR